MLDPTEQAKGGFRAQAERAAERARERSEALAGAGGAGATSPSAAQARGPLAQADGADHVPSRVMSEPVPGAPIARQPRHWH